MLQLFLTNLKRMSVIGKKIGNMLKKELLIARSHFTNMQIAPIQKMALEEKCILVDEQDKRIGEATKKDCHLIDKNGHILLHRAFSVFLFNDKGDLLVQKRSASKVKI